MTSRSSSVSLPHCSLALPLNCFQLPSIRSQFILVPSGIRQQVGCLDHSELLPEHSMGARVRRLCTRGRLAQVNVWVPALDFHHPRERAAASSSAQAPTTNPVDRRTSSSALSRRPTNPLGR